MTEENLLSNIMQEIWNHIKTCTIPLFHNDYPEWKDCRPESLGTGVLLEYGGRYFIVTAAHVVTHYAKQGKRNPYREVEDYDEPKECVVTLENIGFYHDGYYYPLKRVTYVVIETPVGNNVDLAVIPLEEETWKELCSTKRFVGIDSIGIRHTVSTEPRYLVYGYPADWTVLRSEKIISRPFKMITCGIDMKGVGKLRYDERYNLLVEYNPKSLVTESGKSVDLSSPKGISGGGLWYYDANHVLWLVGIMIENKLEKENKPIMMATRMDEVIYIIKKSFING